MTAFDLLGFIPFRLNRLAAEFSEELSRVYVERFGINIVEWRIVATLASQGPCSAQHIVSSTRTHKSRISRGVTRLIERGLVKRLEEDVERREIRLRLTRQGQSLHRQLVPLVTQKEHELLSCLNATEQRAFLKALDRIEHSLGLVQKVDEP